MTSLRVGLVLALACAVLLVCSVEANVSQFADSKLHRSKILLKGSLVLDVTALSERQFINRPVSTQTHLLSRHARSEWDAFHAHERTTETAVDKAAAQAFLVHFGETVVTDTVRLQVRAHLGLSAADKTYYVPHNAYIVYADSAKIRTLQAAVPEVMYVDVLPSEAKVDQAAMQAFTALYIPAQTYVEQKTRHAQQLTSRYSVASKGANGPKYAEQPVSLGFENVVLTFRVTLMEAAAAGVDVQALSESFETALSLSTVEDIMEVSIVRETGQKMLLTVIVAPFAEPEALEERRDVAEVVQELVFMVADLPYVVYIMPTAVYGPNNKYARWSVGEGVNSGVMDSYDRETVFRANGLDGTGLIIGVLDSGITSFHKYFEDSAVDFPMNETNLNHRKVVHYATTSFNEVDDSGHGSHVCGTILGSTVAGGEDEFNANEGMLPAAKVWFLDVEQDDGGWKLPGDMYNDVLLPPYEDGVRVHSDSWGCDSGDSYAQYCNFYSGDEAQLDEFIYDHPDFLMVVAAGNTGQSSVLGTIGSPATMKNGLTVGATSNTNEFWTDYLSNSTYNKPIPAVFYQGAVAAFSSTGPTFDGRIKPEVVAPGDLIMSAQAGTETGTVALSGTSMATPVVAGHAGIVQQYFQDGFHPTGQANTSHEFAPSAALMKAVLINSAVQVEHRQITAKRDNYPHFNASSIFVPPAPVAEAANTTGFTQDALRMTVSEGAIGISDTFQVRTNGCEYFVFTAEEPGDGQCSDYSYENADGDTCADYNPDLCSAAGGLSDINDPTVTAFRACCICLGGDYTGDVHFLGYTPFPAHGDTDISLYHKDYLNTAYLESFNYNAITEFIVAPLHLLDDLVLQVCAYNTTLPIMAVGTLSDPETQSFLPDEYVTCATTFLEVNSSVVWCPTNCYGPLSGNAGTYSANSSICSAALSGGQLQNTHEGSPAIEADLLGAAVNFAPVSFFLWDPQAPFYMYNDWKFQQYNSFSETFFPSSPNATSLNGYIGWMATFEGHISSEPRDTMDFKKSGGITAVNGDTYGFRAGRPNFNAGYGRVQLDNALFLASEDSLQQLNILGLSDDFLEPSIEHEAVVSYELDLQVNAEEVVVTLVWTDPPGFDGAGMALVNDLDLTVSVQTCATTDDTTLYYGNGNTIADHVNNVEQVTLDNLAASGCETLLVTVTGYNVPQGPQTYSLIVRGDVEQGFINADDNLDGALTVAPHTLAVTTGVLVMAAINFLM